MSIPFSKLLLDKEKINDVKVVDICGQQVEVKQYLPSAEKLKLTAAVLNGSMDQNNFKSPIKVQILTELAIVQYFTDITFTDDELEDPTELYDSLKINGIFDAVKTAVPKNEYIDIQCYVDDTLYEFYNYKNSAMGILETISADYSNLELDAQELNDKIAKPENLTLLKNVIDKLG